MKDKTKKKIILYIKEHPLEKFSSILQNANAIKNHNQLKKYLKELVEEKSVKYIPYYNAYLVLPIPRKMKRNILLALTEPLILEGFEKLDTHTKKELNKINRNYDFTLQKFNVKNKSLHKQVLFKFYKSWLLKKSLLQTDLENILKNNRIKKRILNKEIDGIISFGEKFKKFLDEYKIISKSKMKKLEKELDQSYHTDIEYALKIWKSKMEMSKTLSLAIIENIVGTKEASKFHLKMRKASKGRKEYEVMDKRRTYPRKMTSTKRIISKMYTNGKFGEKQIPDIEKIMTEFLSSLGRQGVKEVSTKLLNLHAITFVLRNFLDYNGSKTAEEKRLEVKIEKIFSKLYSSIS
ncbi:MAG: hypothetical protein ISR80_04320 [Nitrosopumilus sp.]|nr:hypothetical protein [Nitrosopumilus sp.]